MPRKPASKPACLKRSRTGLILALAGMVAACSYVGLGESDKDATAYRMIYTPNGEPLLGGPLGRPSCEQAIGAWFDRIDSNHDGHVTKDEFLADARRQFDVMDLDHDGTITPAELDKYRAPYIALPPPSTNGRAPRQRAQSYSSGPDPVMAADTRLRFVVTQQDFLMHAEREFVRLDRNRNGTLERDEVLKMCDTER